MKYKGEVITKWRFISICRHNGICAGRLSYYEQLCKTAKNGNAKAIEILKDLNYEENE